MKEIKKIASDNNKQCCPFVDNDIHYCRNWAGTLSCSIPFDFTDCYLYLYSYKHKGRVYFSYNSGFITENTNKEGYLVYKNNRVECRKFIDKANNIKRFENFSKEHPYYIHRSVCDYNWEVKKSESGEYTKDCTLKWFETEADALSFIDFVTPYKERKNGI